MDFKYSSKQEEYYCKCIDFVSEGKFEDAKKMFNLYVSTCGNVINSQTALLGVKVFGNFVNNRSMASDSISNDDWLNAVQLAHTAMNHNFDKVKEMYESLFIYKLKTMLKSVSCSDVEVINLINNYMCKVVDNQGVIASFFPETLEAKALQMIERRELNSLSILFEKSMNILIRDKRPDNYYFPRLQYLHDKLILLMMKFNEKQNDTEVIEFINKSMENAVVNGDDIEPIFPETLLEKAKNMFDRQELVRLEYLLKQTLNIYKKDSNESKAYSSDDIQEIYDKIQALEEKYVYYMVDEDANEHKNQEDNSYMVDVDACDHKDILDNSYMVDEDCNDTINQADNGMIE